MTCIVLLEDNTERKYVFVLVDDGVEMECINEKTNYQFNLDCGSSLLACGASHGGKGGCIHRRELQPLVL